MADLTAMQQAMYLNQAQRSAVLQNAVTMKQVISSQTVIPANQSVLNIAPRNVGLIKGFLIEVSGTLTNGATTVAALSNFGISNIVRNFQFTDLNNNVRVNIPGWYLALLNSARQGWGYGGVYANNLPMGYGNTWNIFAGPATIAVSTDAAVKFTYYLPLAYSGDDLRGSIYAAVVSATMNLQITLNTAPFVGAVPADQIGAMYTNNAAGGWKTGTGVNVTVYQHYWDQIPISQGQPVLPMMDLNTIYELKQTTLTGVNANQDFPVPYANFRDFLSTTAVYDNAGVYASGSDINYWSLTSANYTNLFKLGPNAAALEARQVFMADLPPGTYYFPHRDRPINTISFGNMELNINAVSASAGAQVLVGFEAFAQVNQLLGSGASSLSAG